LTGFQNYGKRGTVVDQNTPWQFMEEYFSNSVTKELRSLIRDKYTRE
jgi:hypothetical protein